jgi:hypothetical protein
MDAKSAADLQRDEQLEGSMETAMRTQVEAALKNTHTCLPGIVRSFDATTQTAQVQPAIKRIFIELGPVDLPPCVDVPVVFPSGGNFVLTFPVAADDECLLIFSERAIDFWFEKGGVQLPSEYRLHDLSDAYALVGVRSKPKAAELVAFNTTAAELRTKDGTTVLRIDGTSVYVGGAVGAQPTIMGTAYRSAEDTYFAALETYLAALGGLPGMTAPAGVFNTAAGVFHTAAATYLAQKAKVL